MSDEPELEFFADEDTAEIASRVGQKASASRLPPPSWQIRRRRLTVVATAAAIAIILIVVLATQGSSGPSAAYRAYLAKLSPIATHSQRTGRALAALLSRMRAGVEGNPMPSLARLAGQARDDLIHASQLRPPARLVQAHLQALVALGFRVTGLQGLDRAVGLGLGSAGTTVVGAVAAQMDRLTTSDVLWTDRVISPIDALLAKSGIQGATTPPSRFIT